MLYKYKGTMPANTSITIKDGTLGINNYAFYGCSGLTSVTIPNSVTTIGGNAFYNCTGLTNVTIPNSVTSIGSSAFEGCTGLRIVYNNSSLDITAGSSNHGSVAYYANAVITPNSNMQSDFIFKTTDGKHTLTGYIGNDSIISLPENYNGENYSIGNAVFQNNKNITSITIPNSVISIGGKAFYNCTGLTNVTIPNSVTSIESSAFNGCTGLTAVHISDLSAWCKIYFSNDSSNPLYYAKNLYLNGEKITNLVIPSDITEIKDYAFKNCTGLTSVTIPNSVTSIGNSAFERCTGLTSIEIPNSVTSIGSSAFWVCTGLRIVYNNSSLNITAGSYNHGYVAYYADIIVTKDDDIKGDFIFRTADNTNTLIAYAGNDSVITLPENYNGENYTIVEKAFRNCTGLTSVTIPNSVTKIGSSAFSGCSSLKSVTIGNGVTTIVSNTFLDCTGLNSVTIPESVEDIAANAFKGCTSITEIYSMAEVPAVITETSFPNYSATLYVPYGAKRIYKITDGWSKFSNIVEMEPVEDPEEERLVGDVDGDGSIDIADVAALVEIILGTKQ